MSGVTEQFIAGILNKNLNETDIHQLNDAIQDYFGEREDSEDEFDESDSNSDDFEQDVDECFFSPVHDITDAVLPARQQKDATGNSLTTAVQQVLCHCTLNDGLPCHSIFDPHLLADIRMQYEAMTKAERDIAVLSKIECFIHISSETERTNKKCQTVRKRTRNDYCLHGRRICRDVFQYVHCIGEKQLDSLNKHYRNVGVQPRVHGRSKMLPANSLSFDDNKRVVDFIIHYADVHAITLPGRTPHHWVSSAQLLPTNCSKKTVYDAYKEVSLAASVKVAAERTFRRIWQNLVPFIRTMKPASDLCFTCQKGAAKVARSANLPVEAKSLAIREMEEHLLTVTKERSYLRSVLELAKRELPPRELGKHAVCSFEGTSHYSFDFAQQLQFPSNPLQPGPIYFKVPRKCGLFGVHCEALSRQVNFLIDESVCVGKGADCVISLLHFFFENFGLGESNVHLHADNCSGQNKNSAMLQYLLWRVLTNRHKSIILSFLITGHTKFSPDGAFGLIKRRFRKTEVNSLSQLEAVVTGSSTMCGREDGEVLVPSHQWTVFLARFFKKLDGLKQYQHFRFLQDGSVVVKFKADSEELKPFKLLKSSVDLPSDFPESKNPPGLDNKRKNYLFKEIRPFVADEFKDIVTPQPDVENVTDIDDEIVQPPPSKKSKGKEKSKGKSKGQ